MGSVAKVHLRAQPAPELAVGGEKEALKASVEHLFERQSVVKEHEIMAEAINHSLGKLDLNQLKKLCREGEAGLVSLTPQDGLLAECATKQGLILERWAVSYVNATKQKCSPLNPAFVPAKELSLDKGWPFTRFFPAEIESLVSGEWPGPGRQQLSVRCSEA